MTTLPVADQWYERQRFSHDVTCLREPHVDAFARCNIWHVRGRDKDLVVDTGLGVVSLQRAAADLLGRPVAAVLTHSHFDHVGGAHEFEERLAHVEEEAEMAAPSGFAGLTAAALGVELVERLRAAGYELPDQLVTALPHAGYELTSFSVKRAPLTRTLVDGDVLDLGDRTFEVLHLPGHSPGSIGLFERRTRTLFSGDAIYDGPLLYELPGSSLVDYARTLRRLLSLDVDVVHAGHDPSFGRAQLRDIAERHLALWQL
jgi:glyoxylase-like metal-dependent hydrolase (beta-lactamase superfamily II)